ncbi:AN1-type zinc finger protein 2A-like [Centruroides sculpturatus]|uniref:AN1-type zinc finger protein 2A-like n=1 Tax=Centruroides sculpturatus TaxID=218467 RepID=UPI000C6CB36F|nr:AN1-type zinc finger protein 2A-like [Centruroides sculpturatus]
MELPDLGEHCSEQTCNRLDFLPMKCDACKKVFCGDHFQYAKHNCKDAYRKDVQVPVCPLCNKPIPVEKGQIPDIVVGQHIDTFCKSDPNKTKRKVSIF